MLICACEHSHECGAQRGRRASGRAPPCLLPGLWYYTEPGWADCGSGQGEVPQGQGCGRAGEAAACTVGIPYGHPCVFCCSASIQLPAHGKSRGKWPRCLGSCPPCGRPTGISGSWRQTGPAWAPGSSLMHGRCLPLSPHCQFSREIGIVFLRDVQGTQSQLIAAVVCRGAAGCWGRPASPES